ncbi:pilus assembly protein PilV [Variovorax rhizosphaerae]|uniref:Pilus assembly protein PilV n=1 Tax=Variovorax rhizosphaerae TaxID=1836200 RepID=A0ABU8WCQ8_9BURK
MLVSLLVFAFGVLGLVGLQSTMTRAQTESKYRADAANLATEAIGRMWSDLGIVASYNGADCASIARCKEWQDKVGTSLPQGTGALDLNTGTGDVTITVRWTSPGGETHRYVTATTIARSGG